MKNIKVYKRSFVVSILIYVCALFSSPAARTDFYVDPQWTKKENGSEQFPWRGLSDEAWRIINATLLNDDVTIFFSAHTNSDDSDNFYDPNHDLRLDGIELLKRAADTKYYLLFDGGTYYNSNDNGKWKVNSSKSMCKVKYFNSQNDMHRKINRIGINRFRIEKNDNGKAIAICGDYWTISNCDIYHTADVHDGPLILLVPVADKEHGGTNYYAPECTDITITNNTIHSSCGELIYLGGGGCIGADSTGENRCMGFPSHKNITISYNKLYEGGIYGQEGDAIDCKGGLTNVHIFNNEIFNMHAHLYRAITMKGLSKKTESIQAVIEKNYIHNCTGIDDATIAIVNNWGTPQTVEIRNNVITFNDRSGIRIYGGNKIYITNNTICNNRGYGIEILGGTGYVRNNLLIDNDNSEQIISKSKSIVCTNNGFSGKQVICCTNSVYNLTNKVFKNFKKDDFTISDLAKHLQFGIPCKTFSDDFSGQKRNKKVWTVGAFEKQNN